MRDHLFDALAAAACVAPVARSARRRDSSGPTTAITIVMCAGAIARDGHPLSDPFYAGEWIQYNPLVRGSWRWSAAFRMTPSAFHVRGGPWLNLPAPIGFYLRAAGGGRRRRSPLWSSFCFQLR